MKIHFKMLKMFKHLFPFAFIYQLNVDLPFSSRPTMTMMTIPDNNNVKYMFCHYT